MAAFWKGTQRESPGCWHTRSAGREGHTLFILESPTPNGHVRFRHFVPPSEGNSGLGPRRAGRQRPGTGQRARQRRPQPAGEAPCPAPARSPRRTMGPAPHFAILSEPLPWAGHQEPPPAGPGFPVCPHHPRPRSPRLSGHSQGSPPPTGALRARPPAGAPCLPGAGGSRRPPSRADPSAGRSAGAGGGRGRAGARPGRRKSRPSGSADPGRSAGGREGRCPGSGRRPPSRHFVFPSASMDGRGAPGPEARSSPCPGRSRRHIPFVTPRPRSHPTPGGAAASPRP